VLWDHFRQEAPDAGFTFEKFLSSISDSIHTKEKEKVNMEVFIRNQHETREEEVSWNIRLLYNIKEAPLLPRANMKGNNSQKSNLVGVFLNDFFIDEAPVRGNGATN
jgi:hypothetical protein